MATKAPKGTIVEEDRRLFLRKQLEDFRDSNIETIRFPANLSNIERQFIHKVAGELNLVSKSAGAGKDRFISIWKRDSATAPAAAEGVANKLIPWELSPAIHRTLATANLSHSLELLNRELSLVNAAATTTNSGTRRNGRINRLVDALPRIREAYQAAESRRKMQPLNAENQRKRNLLPAAEHRADVIATIKREQITLISGETGCGKSTQVPQFLLEDASIGPTARIVITQPRRISAITLAERIASERCESVGDTIGYNIRLDSKMSAQTQVLFVTPGVLLRKLLEDPDLEEFSHVIVDEAHERDRFTEFLLIVLRDIAQRRNSLKVVLMSATMHTHKLCAYFGDIPQINVGGSVFPVQEFFLEHVLKFIQYTPSSLSSALANANQAPLTSTEASSFVCAVCQRGPFVSAEELGTHCALCFPADPENFVSQYLAHRSLQLPSKQKANKLEALLRRLQWIRQSVKPSLTANQFPSQSASHSSASAAAGSEGLGPNDEFMLENMDEEDSDLDEEDYVQMLATTNPQESTASGLGERFLQSEESSELHQLLKCYQRDLEAASNANENNNSKSDVDYNLIISLLRYIVSSEFGRDQGSILIFLPGWDDISRLHRLLSSCPDFADPKLFLLLQLHSGVPRKEQQLVFQPVQQPGQRKIILSTNIAETSVTIDDVSCVIDSMLVKEKAYDAHTKLSYLKSTYISQASARQRKGRAGRTRAGVCFRLCSVLRVRHLREYQDSELLRMSLEELVLQAKALHLAEGLQGASLFFSKALDPPSDLAVQQAVLLLTALQCITAENEKLTLLGEVIAQLPMSPRQGKMLLLGCLFGLSQTSTLLAAIATGRDPFILPTSDMQRAKVNKEKQTLAGMSMCDQVAVVKALEVFEVTMHRQGRAEANRWCLQHELSALSCQQLVDSAQQIEKSLRELRLPSSTNSGSNSNNTGIVTNQVRYTRNLGSLPLTTLTLSMGLYPDFAVRVTNTANDASNASALFVTEKGAKARIHPASVNAKVTSLMKPTATTTSTTNTESSNSNYSIDIICFQDLVALNAFHKNYRIGGPEYLMLQTTPLSLLGLCTLSGSLVLREDATSISTNIATNNTNNSSSSSSNSVQLVIDGWLHLHMSRSDAEQVVAVRQVIQQALLYMVCMPSTNTSASNVDIARSVDVVLTALAEAQQEMMRSHTNHRSNANNNNSHNNNAGNGGNQSRRY